MKILESDVIMFHTYEKGVRIVCGPTFFDVCTTLKLPWETDSDAKYFGYVQVLDGIVYIFLKDDSTRLTILHECVHAINSIYSMIGADIDPDNDEIYVRDVSWLQEQVLTLFEQHINDVALEEAKDLGK